MAVSPLFKRMDWPVVLFLIGTPVAALTLTPLHIYLQGLHWKVILFFGVYCVVTSLSITAGYHRLFSHKSYEARGVIRFLYLLFGAAAFQGPALQWCSDHRRHHRFVDTEGDPYNIKNGFLFAHIGWLFLKDTKRLKEPFAPDLEKDPLMRFQNKFYAPLSLLMGFGFPTLVGWSIGSPMGGLIYAGFLRAVFTQHCTFLINSLSHTLGRQPYNDGNSARDNTLMAFVSYGEGYHNFHHHFQADYRNGSRWYHWDPTKWTIRFLWLLGAAKGLKCVSSWEILKARLQMDYKRLLEKGIPEEKLVQLKRRVEETQEKLKYLRAEYRRLRKNVREVSTLSLIQIRVDFRMAKLEFKTACAQWSLYRRCVSVLPAY